MPPTRQAFISGVIRTLPRYARRWRTLHNTRMRQFIDKRTRHGQSRPSRAARGAVISCSCSAAALDLHLRSSSTCRSRWSAHIFSSSRSLVTGTILEERFPGRCHRSLITFAAPDSPSPRSLHQRQTHAGGTDDCQTERNRAISRRKEREKEAERSTQFVGHGEPGEQFVISGPDPGSHHVGAATRGDQFPENQRAQTDAQGRFVFRAQRYVCLFRLSGIIVRAYASPPLVSLASAESENVHGQFGVCGERRTNCMKGVPLVKGWEKQWDRFARVCLGLSGRKRRTCSEEAKWFLV